MSEAPLIGTNHAVRVRRPVLGYAMVTAAALLFGVNGTVAKVVLASGLSSLRLTEVRSTGSFLGFALVLLATNPRRLRIRGRELAFLAGFGIVAVAFVQLFYFLAIHRLQIGIALLIQYTAPLAVALWARFGTGEPLRRRIWIALALSLAGLSLVVDIWRGASLDRLGLAYAVGAAVAYTLYLLLGEHAVGRRDPVSLLCFGFLFAALFWSAVQPWWRFPAHSMTRDVSLLGNLDARQLPVWLLVAWIVVFGTMAPFVLVIGALRHLSATRVGIVAMLEPVAGTIVAYVWLDETLGTVQIVGSALVLCAIFLAQTARSHPPAA